MYIIITILAFGILIATHELGHFVAAKLCGIKVNEFSIGMGPAIFKKQKGETLYALRVLPIGGYCAMEGEDEETEDPRSFSAQAPWKRFIVLVAGSAMNFFTGVIIVIFIFSGYSGFVSNEVVAFADGFELEGEDGLMPGDKIIEINGSRICYADDFSVYMSRANNENVDLTILRDGEKIYLEDFPLVLREYEENGQVVTKYGISFGVIPGNFWTRLQYSLYTSLNFVRNVFLGFSDLIAGRAGIKDLSGPVGIVSIISDAAEQAPSTNLAILNIAYLCAFIAVNLAVMNMLPIPALDGGRVFFLIISSLFMLITKKKIDPKYEGYVHTVGFMLLLALMAVVMFNDIRRLI